MHADGTAKCVRTVSFHNNQSRAQSIPGSIIVEIPRGHDEVNVEANVNVSSDLNNPTFVPTVTVHIGSYHRQFHVSLPRTRLQPKSTRSFSLRFDWPQFMRGLEYNQTRIRLEYPFPFEYSASIKGLEPVVIPNPWVYISVGDAEFPTELNLFNGNLIEIKKVSIPANTPLTISLFTSSRGLVEFPVLNRVAVDAIQCSLPFA